MNLRKVPTSLIIGVLLAIFFGISLYLRAYLPYNDIFVKDWIKFSSNDAYYYMRIVDNLAYNFPHLNKFDPYIIYPGGGGIGGILFFGWLLAGVSWAIGLGSPTQHTIDVVSVYFPAILAALAVIPVYLIGKNLFSRGAGLLAAALIAILPGEFMGRSILGFTDHHIAESLFTAVAMLFLILAVKSGVGAQLTYGLLRRGNWAVSARTLIYALLAGIFLGIYLITWIGGLLFAFIISVYLIIQFVIDHLKGRSTDYLGIIGVILFLTATAIFVPLSEGPLNRDAMILALLVPVVLSGVSHLMAARQLQPAYYPLTLVGVGVVALGILYAIDPSLLRSMLERFSIFAPAGPSLTTLEMQPLFSAGWALPWGNFTTGFFFSIVTWLILVYQLFKHGNAEKTILIVWTLVIFAATLGQRRFAYYFAVNVAVLTGYLAWQAIWLAGLKKLAARPVPPPEKPGEKHSKPRRKRRSSSPLTVSHINATLAAIVVFFFVFFPDFEPARVTAAQARYAPSDAWCDAMTWLKDNSPEPFGSPDFYYQLYQPPKPGQSYDYPKTVYGVTAWWDYGYWIMRIAHRPPTVNPSQDPQAIISVTRLFLSQNETAAALEMQKLDSRYIVIDNQTTTSKFWAVITWAGRNQTDFFEDLYFPPQKVFVRLFYPEYYRTLTSRLYNFDAKAVTPKNIIVIAWEPRQSTQGKTYKEITSAQAFEDYNAATAYIQGQKSGNYRIVGNNAFISPVPLEALKDYKLVYASPQGVSQTEVGAVPEVKIFEYSASGVSPPPK